MDRLQGATRRHDTYRSNVERYGNNRSVDEMHD